MRAAVLTDDKRFEVRELPDPEATPGRVVVRVTACGICGSDLHMVEQGIMPPDAVLGHEFSGVVETMGEGAGRIEAGDPVAVRPFEPCGECTPCVAGAEGRCEGALATTHGLGMRPGAYAELVECAPGQLFRLPDAFPVEHGALAEPLAVALRGLRRADVSQGASVGVIGCGPIGLCTVLAAKALGADEVWACDTNAFRTGLAEKAGADATGRAPQGTADVVVECAGARGTLDLAVGAAEAGGTVVILAANMQGDEVVPAVWVAREVRILPSIAYTPDEYDEAARLIETDRVDVEPLITNRVSLDELDGAFHELLEGADEGKVLVTP